MVNNKNRIGKGLGSIFNDKNKSLFEEINKGSNSLNNVISIPLKDIKPNPYQPRKKFNPTSIKDLANSLEKEGLIQPIIINKKNFIIVGERRYKAAQLLGWKKIKVIVKNANEKEMATLALSENLLREDINPIEEANGYKTLIDLFKWTHEDIAKQFSKSRSYITNTLRLLNLPKQIILLLEQGTLTAGHGRMLLQLKQKNLMIKKAKEIVKEKTPVNKVIIKTSKTNNNLENLRMWNSLYNCWVIIKKKKIVLEFNNKIDLNNFKDNFLKKLK